MSEGAVGGEGGGVAPAEGGGESVAPAGGLDGFAAEMGAGSETPAAPLDIATVPDWANEFSPELKDMISAKKYADPESLAQAYFHAEKRLGAPADKLLEIPDWEDAESAGKFYDAVGRPKDESSYELIEGLDAMDVTIADQLRPTLYEFGISQRQWAGLQAKFSELGADGLKNVEAAQNEQLAADTAALRQQWGADYESKVNLGIQAGKAIGISDEIVNGLKQVVGFKGTAELLEQISRVTGEHSMEFGGGDGGGPGFGQTPDAARAEVQRMQRDPVIAQKFKDNDPETVAKVNRLVEIYSQKPNELT